MRSFESGSIWVLSYLLNSLWQIPLLFAAGWIAARALRSVGRRGGTPCLGECPAAAGSSPGIFYAAVAVAARTLRLEGDAHRTGEAHVSVLMGAGMGLGTFHLPRRVAYGDCDCIWRQ